MQKIIPNLWFDHTAAEAAAFYASVFPDAQVTDTQYYPTEGLLDFQQEFAGKELTVGFEIAGYRFIGINAGAEFPLTPSLSFMLNFDADADPAARDQLDALWAALTAGGQVLMPLQEYDFSPHYGWVADRYGVSWQLMLTHPQGVERPFVRPCLLFGGAAQNRAGEAYDYYSQLFPDTQAGPRMLYQQPVGPAIPGRSVLFSELQLLGQWVVLMDAGAEQDFTFNPGVSLMIEADGQTELDRYWAALSAVPEAEQCGWCTDRFGVSWQVIPSNLEQLMQAPDAYATLMGMKKIEIAAFG
ncbi:MAG: VOC family protein [Propionicimonas sp.]|nr:VOC family protein [Propionicimonas sp.]